MPAYNFKKQFAEAVASGRKTCTIREVRKKRPTRVGDRLFLFTGMQRRGCRLLKDTECVKLTPIGIRVTKTANGFHVWVSLNLKTIPAEELDELAWNDGFISITEFGHFFFTTYGEEFIGELIEWRA